MRKISVGLNWQGAFDIRDAVEQAKIADDSGVHLMSVAEAWGRDAFSILGVLAYETSRINLGTSIVNIFSRTPGALAQHFSTLDELSNGRAVAGIGSSGPQVIEHFHGIKFDRPLTRMREYVDIMRMLFDSEPLHYNGHFFKLDRGFTLRDYQRTHHIPIHIASITPKSVEQTAQIADGWIPIFVPREQWKTQTSTFYDHVRAAGRNPEDVEIRGGGVTVTDDPEKGYASIAQGAAFYIARMGDFYYEHFVRIGLADEANMIRQVWREKGSEAAFAAMPEELVHSLGYAGPVEGCIEWLEEAREAGYTINGASVDEKDPKKRAEIYKKLVG